MVADTPTTRPPRLCRTAAFSSMVFPRSAVALIRPGLRGRRSARLCGPSRRPRRSARRRFQLDQWFSSRQHQGVVIRSQAEPIDVCSRPRPVSRRKSRLGRDLLRHANRRHSPAAGDDERWPHDAYELAAKMQRQSPPSPTCRGSRQPMRLYGIDARNRRLRPPCLLARRLLERGVRFVQLFSRRPFAGTPRINWDGHENMKAEPRARSAPHRPARGRVPRAICGSGACSTTRWCCSPPSSAARRSPNRRPTCWAAAATTTSTAFQSGWPAPDCRHGIAYGLTDDIGWKATDNPVPWHDFHATVLHLLGIDHERLTLLPQRHPPPADQRPRRSRQRHPRLA